MSISLLPFSQLDADSVAANVALALEAVSEDNPSLDLRSGPLADLLVRYHALLATQLQENLAQYLEARSLLALSNDPTLASVDPTLLDAVLSNYLITRQPGAAATGTVDIYTSSDVTMLIAQGSLWVGNGLTFTTTATYTAKSEEALLNSPTDRLLTAVGDLWVFSIPVVAVTAGAAGNLAANTALVPQNPPVNFVRASAEGSFTGGLDAQTNTQLLAQLQNGIAAKVLGNRGNMAAYLEQNPAFTGVVSQSVIGLGDPELIRAFHSILPIALPGRVDWYVRTALTVNETSLTKTCTFLADNHNGTSTWQFSLARDDAPGFYDVTFITLGDDTINFAVSSDVRDLDLTAYANLPDVLTPLEGTYSRFQTAIIKFLDSVTNVSALSPGATAPYNILVRSLPLLGEIQDALEVATVRGLGADCLVKAAVPCFVGLSFTIFTLAGQSAPDTAGMAASLSAAVNNVGFTGQLYVSQLHAIVNGYLAAGMNLGDIAMTGVIRYPDGTYSDLSSSSVLQVPNLPSDMVSANTVQFFLDPGDVSITLTPVS